MLARNPGSVPWPLQQQAGPDLAKWSEVYKAKCFCGKQPLGSKFQVIRSVGFVSTRNRWASLQRRWANLSALARRVANLMAWDA